ncbi:MAG: hypothetical protein RL264_1136 [Bacteroidota bacterium]|jgi:hypothetical protein
MEGFYVLIVALVALGVMLYLSYHFLGQQNQKEVRYLQGELMKQRQEFFLPSRLEAYQRAILLMERIHPNSLVMRLHNPGMPAKLQQAEFLKAIREEYNHNVAQQLFVSPVAWKMVKDAKEDITKLVNLAGDQMSPTATGMELSAKILEMVSQLEVLTSDVAIDYMKKEFQQLF